MSLALVQIFNAGPLETGVCLLLNLFLGERGSSVYASHNSRPLLMPANAGEASICTTGQDFEQEGITEHRHLRLGPNSLLNLVLYGRQAADCEHHTQPTRISTRI